MNRIVFGARNYNPTIGRFNGIDPRSSERNWVSPYNFVQNNPINRIDPDGSIDIVIQGANNSSITVVTDLVDITVDASYFVGDLGGNYSLGGDEIVEAALDIGGLVDPTGAVDVAAAVYYGGKGEIGNAIISTASVLPGGDLLKGFRVGKHVKTIKNAISAVKRRKQVTRVSATRKRALDARPKPSPAQKGGKRVTRQSRNKNGEGKKFKTDRGSQTEHVHDRNHSSKTKPNVHYRVGTKRIKPN